MNDYETRRQILVNGINEVSMAFFKILGIDISKEINYIETGKIITIRPCFNAENQLVLPLKSYLEMDTSMKKRLRELNMISVEMDNGNILDLIDSIEDSKEEKNSNEL